MTETDAFARLAAAYAAAWNSGSAEAVASFYADAGEIVINGDGRWVGRDRVREMVAGFFANVPDMVLRCDGSRHAGAQAVFLWTFTGHDATSGKPLTVHGWEEWRLDCDLKVVASRGWYDAADYARQAGLGGPDGSAG